MFATQVSLLYMPFASTLAFIRSVLVPSVDESCWSGAFTRHFCCNGVMGQDVCWQGEYTYERCCGLWASVWPHNRVLEHPLMLQPPTLCSAEMRTSIAQNYTGLNFCPPVLVEHFRRDMLHLTKMVPPDYWMLDAPAFLSLVSQQVQLSFFVVNLGAKPSKGVAYEDGDRKPARGDDCTPLYFMGFKGLNFDLPAQKKMMMDFYSIFGPEVAVQLDMVAPPTFSDVLVLQAIPRDLDFFKVDVDSYECDYVANVLANGFRPKVIDVELSVLWPPPLKFSLRYAPDSNYDYEQAMMTALSGCSLQYAVDMLKPHGYTLIQYQLQDGWFVRDEFVDIFGSVPRDTRQLYHIGNPYMYDGMARFGWGQTQQELVALNGNPEGMLAHAQAELRRFISQHSLEHVQYELTVGRLD